MAAAGRIFEGGKGRWPCMLGLRSGGKAVHHQASRHNILFITFMIMSLTGYKGRDQHNTIFSLSLQIQLLGRIQPAMFTQSLIRYNKSDLMRRLNIL